MIKEITIRDNFFADPDKIIRIANQLNYKTPNSNDNWVGKRSEELSEVLSENEIQDLYKTISAQIFDVAMQGICEYAYQYKAQMYFHYLDKLIKHDPKFFHRDTSLFAGVVYLAKNPCQNSGTVVNKNGSEIKIDNVFNRCVIYHSDFFHAPLDGFGEEIDTARLTLNITFSEIYLAKHTSRSCK
jgi:hypothetical protein